ncbi:MAG TPA: Crp/Fnr family transcriptional regulator [Anaerolineae bacterium]|nr:Crp/Fnr family transcriptional regulator [Anaerolineae bacterium]
MTSTTTTKAKLGFLSDIELFQDLSPKEIEELERLITISSVKRGKVFYRPEEAGEVLFILKSGHVQLYRISPEGKKLVIASLGAGTLFGEMPLLGQQLHNTFAEAAEDCVIFVMSRKDLERLFLNKPQVALRVLDITGRRLRDVEDRLQTMAFKGIPARLASLLLLLAEEHDSLEVVGLTHQDLAETVGTYRETATQVLNDLKAQGLIDIGRKRITILDPEGLLAVAES